MAVKGKIGEKKRQDLEYLKGKIEKYKSFVIADYSGLSVMKITELRNRLREKNGECKVVKNTLFRLALKENGIIGYEDYIVGPIAVIWGDSIAGCAKVAVEFEKEDDNFQIKGGYIEGDFLDKNGVVEISKLPSREEMLAILAGLFKAPMTKLARDLYGPLTKMLGLVNALKDKKE